MQDKRLNPFPSRSEAEWKHLVLAGLKGHAFETLVAETDDGIKINPLEMPLPDAQPLWPYREWHISTRIDHPNSGNANHIAHRDVSNGVEQLTIVFSNSAAARGYGVDSSTTAALRQTLDDLRLDRIRFRLDAKSEGVAPAETFASLVQEQNLDPARITVDFGLDVIGNIALRGTMSAPWQTVIKRQLQYVEQLKHDGFRGPFYCADSRPWHEAGATEVQELAATLSTAAAYVKAQWEAGLDPSEAFANVSMVVTADSDQFLSVAKIRAMQLLWTLIQKTCGLQPRPPILHVETSYRMLTRENVHGNILRNTSAAFSAVVAGASTLTVLPHTSAVGLPDVHAREIARDTQLLLRHETDVWRSADPAAGSGAFEKLTDDLADQAWQMFQAFEKRNADEPGIIAALRDGTLQAAIANSHRSRLARLISRQKQMVGVNVFNATSEARVDIETFSPSPQASSVTSCMAVPLPSYRLSEPFEAANTGAA